MPRTLDTPWNPEDLKGGRLADVAATCMLQGRKRALFRKIAKARQGDFPDILDAYTSLYGWRPSGELGEWTEAAEAYAHHFYDISDVWVLEGNLVHAPAMLRTLTTEPALGRLALLVNDADFMLTMLAGLERWGSDPCGDQVFASTLPHPLGTAEIHRYNHEVGELDDSTPSRAAFVATHWSHDEDEDSTEEGEEEDEDAEEEEEDGSSEEEEEEEEPEWSEDDLLQDEEIPFRGRFKIALPSPVDVAALAAQLTDADLDDTPPPIRAVQKAFASAARKAVKKRPVAHDAAALFGRSAWLQGITSGREPWAMAEKLCKSPTFATWEKERPKLAESPTLCTYWALAH